MGAERRGRTPGAPVVDYNRIMERMEKSDEAITQRLEDIADRIGSRLDRIERDGAAGEQERHTISSELAAMRVDNSELRQAIQIVRNEMAAHVAVGTKAAGVAATAATGAAVSAASILVALRKAKFWQKGGVGFLALIAIAWAGDKGPGVVRFLNAWARSVVVFWKGVGGG